MPLYEYKCRSCGVVFEVIQKFSDEPVRTHENCGGDVARLISPSAFHFKGSGWYVTDYAKGKSSQSDKNGKGTGDKGAETKTSEKKESAPVSSPASEKK